MSSEFFCSVPSMFLPVTTDREPFSSARLLSCETDEEETALRINWTLRRAKDT